METMSISTPKTTTESSNTIKAIARIFSAVMEEEITPRQSLLIIHAIVALFFGVFTCGLPFWFNLICAAWFYLALRLCKNAGLGTDETQNSPE